MTACGVRNTVDWIVALQVVKSELLTVDWSELSSWIRRSIPRTVCNVHTSVSLNVNFGFFDLIINTTSSPLLRARMSRTSVSQHACPL